MDWIIHLDTDELVHPVGAQEYSLRQLLLDVPGNVDMVIFPNYVRVHYIFLFCNLVSNCKALQLVDVLFLLCFDIVVSCNIISMLVLCRKAVLREMI